jgi:cytochrome P450
VKPGAPNAGAVEAGELAVVRPSLAVVRPSLDDARALRDGPHEFLLALHRAHGPAIRFGFGPVSFFLLNDPQYVQSVLVAGHREFTRHTFQYRLLASVTGDGLLTMDGGEWLARRRLEQPMFHLEAVRAWTALIVRATERVLDDWDESARTGSPRDVAKDMMRLALDVIIGVLFPSSFRCDQGAMLDATMQVLSHIRDRSRALGVIPPWLPTSANRRFGRAIRALDDIIHQTIRSHCQAGGGGTDLLSLLMFENGGDHSELSDRELRDELLTMIIAGHETVASALAWAWHLLAEHEDSDERLGEEAQRVPEGVASAGAFEKLSFAGNVFDETLRLFPPAWLITRKAVQSADLGAFNIPAGGLVAISPWVLQRDPALWAQPDRFEPLRFSAAESRPTPKNAYIPFGAGPHLCIGAHLARLEARIVLGLAARRFRLRMVADRPPLIEPGVTLHPKNGLWMHIERRDHRMARPSD